MDFQGELTLVRSYNSQGQRDVGLGMGWTSNLHKSLSIYGNTLLVHDADGRSEKWTRTAGAWRGEPYTRLRIMETPEGFTLIRPGGDREHYDHAGRLQSETDTNGNSTNYQYDSGNRLTRVWGALGAHDRPTVWVERESFHRGRSGRHRVSLCILRRQPGFPGGVHAGKSHEDVSL